MQDRIPKYPGRVALVPVTGADNIYDMVRADEPIEAGDPLSKATFLKDATATLLGFNTPKTTLPDDALRVLNATYGTCGTAAGTVAKVVVCPNFILKTGARIAVRFSATNTVNNPTLNVNGTGAKSIARYGSSAPFPYMWQAGAVVEFFYDGNRWIMLSGTTATTTYYGPTILYDGIDSTSTTMAATANAVRSAYRKIIDENINPAKITVTASQSYNLGDIVDISGTRTVSNYIFTPGELVDAASGNWPYMSAITSDKIIIVYHIGSGSTAIGYIRSYTVSNGNIKFAHSTTFSRNGNDGEYSSSEDIGRPTMVSTNVAIMYGNYSSSAIGPDVEEFNYNYRYEIQTSSSSVTVLSKKRIDSETAPYGGFQISGTNFIYLSQSGSSKRIAKRTYNISNNSFSEGTAYTFTESGTLNIIHAFSSNLFLMLKEYKASSSSNTQYTFQVRDAQGNLKSSITVPDGGENFKVIGVSSTKAIMLRYDGIAYIITISSTGSTITLSEPIKIFNRSSDVIFTDACKKNDDSALFSVKMGSNIYLIEIHSDGTFVDPIIFVTDEQKSVQMNMAVLGDNLAYMKANTNWNNPAQMIQVAAANRTNNNSEGLIMANVSSGQLVDVCLDGNMPWAIKKRGDTITSPRGEQVAYCYADGLVNVVGKWRRNNTTMSAAGGSSSSSGSIPNGTIIMWSGAISDIPEGYALCDGTNGTPDLRNRFIVGAGNKYNVGATGGKIGVDVNTSPFLTQNYGSYAVTGVQGYEPPYYALAYIMKV